MKYFILLSATFFLLACGSNKADNSAEQEDTVVAANAGFYWQSDLDTSGNLAMKKVPTTDTVSMESTIAFLNKEHPNVQLEFVKTSGDTIYVRIPDATYLTQQMGSTGPVLYFSKVVYNLTEFPYKEVTFDFEEGDHASPGTMNRDSFKDQ